VLCVADASAESCHTSPRTMSACVVPFSPPALKKLPNLPLLGSSWPRPGVMVPFVSAQVMRWTQVSGGYALRKQHVRYAGGRLISSQDAVACS
jgi:hypothetical protein